MRNHRSSEPSIAAIIRKYTSCNFASKIIGRGNRKKILSILFPLRVFDQPLSRFLPTTPLLNNSFYEHYAVSNYNVIVKFADYSTLLVPENSDVGVEIEFNNVQELSLIHI